MRPTTARRLINLGRLLPLLLSICAVATYFVWTFAPHWVAWVDRGILKTYVGHSLEGLEDATRLLATDHQGGARELHALIEDLSEYRKGDRRADVAKQALVRLAGAHAAKGEYQKAASVLEKFLGIDEKDLNTRSRLYSYMAKVPARRAEAITALREWHQRFPGNYKFSEPLADLLAEDGQVGEGWQVHLTQFHRSQINVWTLKWAQGYHDHRSMIAWLVPRAIQGGTALTFQLPVLTTSFELRLPIHSYARFEQLKLSCEWDGGEIEVPWTADMLDGISEADGVYYIFSSHPKIKVGELAAARAQLKLGPHQRLTIHLTTKGTLVPSPAMAMYARRHRVQLASRATEHDDQGTVQLVAQAVRDALLYDFATFYWHAKGQGFHGSRRVAARFKVLESDQRTTFSVDFPVESTARRIRFDPPFLPTFTWQITAIELRTDGQSIQVDIDKPIALVDMKKVEGGYALLADDPYLVYELPKEIKFTSVRVTGSIR